MVALWRAYPTPPASAPWPVSVGGPNCQRRGHRGTPSNPLASWDVTDSGVALGISTDMEGLLHLVRWDPVGSAPESIPGVPGLSAAFLALILVAVSVSLAYEKARKSK